MTIEEKKRALVAIAALLATLLFMTQVPALHKKVDGQPFYSLIVTDAYQQEWVVDYNLTFNDCQGQRASPAAYCARQPEKLP